MNEQCWKPSEELTSPSAEDKPDENVAVLINKDL